MEKRYLANVVVRRQVKRENSSLPVAARVSKTRMLKLPNRAEARECCVRKKKFERKFLSGDSRQSQ